MTYVKNISSGTITYGGISVEPGQVGFLPFVPNDTRLIMLPNNLAVVNIANEPISESKPYKRTRSKVRYSNKDPKLEGRVTNLSKTGEKKTTTVTNGKDIDLHSNTLLDVETE